MDTDQREHGVPDRELTGPGARLARWRVPAIAAAAGLLVGSVVGVVVGHSSVDPMTSAAYLDLAAQLEDTEDRLTEIDNERADARIAQQQAEVRERDLRESIDERESAIEELAEELAEWEARLAEREGAVEVAEDARAERSFGGNGTYVVGEDIEAGTYRSDGGDLCYWARLSDLSSELDGIIANHAGAGPAVVTIRPSDKAFQTQGCAMWERQD